VDPSRVDGVAAGAGFTAYVIGGKIQDCIMVLNASAGVVVDRVDMGDKGEFAGGQAGFLKQFAAGGGFGGFTEFLGAPWEAPGA
jgi:hypothetical protein